MEKPADQSSENPSDESKADYPRWIPLVVPLLAVAMASGVYLIAAEVLKRVT
jgi:hypothetical protein